MLLCIARCALLQLCTAEWAQACSAGATVVGLGALSWYLASGSAPFVLCIIIEDVFTFWDSDYGSYGGKNEGW